MSGLTPKRGISQGGSGSAKKRRLVTESYDEKLERRHENRQSLFGRNNITSCRSSPRQRGAEQSSRQEEFLKRRNLTTGEKVVKPKSPSVSHCRTKNSVGVDTTVTASTADPQLILVPSQQNLIAVTQMSPQFTSANDGMSFSNQLSHRGTKDSSPTFAMSTLIRSDTVFKKVSKKDKATQVPSAESNGFGNGSRKEASQQTECGVAVLDQEIWQLSEYLKEALHREVMLKQKMAILQQLLATVLQAAEKSWKVQLDDDSLRCKLLSLETQLHTWAQNHSRDSVKESMIEMQEQKLKYENVAKEALRRAIEEKNAAEQSLDNVQRSLREAEQESAHWKESYHRAMADCAEVTAQHSRTTDQLHVVESRLQRAESDGVVLRNLQNKLEAVENETQKLLNQIDGLKEDNELKQKQLLISRAELQKAEEQQERMVSMITNLQDTLQKKFTEATEQEKTVLQNGEFRARIEQREVALQLEIRQLTDRLERQSHQLHAKQEECSELHSKLVAVWNEHHAHFKHQQGPQDEPGTFQKRPAQRRCCRCVAFVLMAAMVAGFAVLWANLDKIPF
ncbi:TRAF3-interacting JNK-activating modulator isoform X2 [Pristis pectinata]|uniref:TRAF3-interacting JNK-activating modulator isoform X2 n=1 Tax=Pristis pectinata TaxID=685728 RepID=UPI00223E564E|nr:TRAF3-interacting JNK-activating modulator isoform X2 [Pristis pectinata]